MIFKKKILFFTSLFFVQLVIAQGGASIKATVDKNSILIGQPMQLTIEVYLSPESVMKFITIDSIEHFEFIEKPVIDTSNRNGGWNIKGVYKITSFDSGSWVIPSFYLSPALRTDSIPVDVVFSDFDPNQNYHDIKDILEVKPFKKKKTWWWYVAGGALFLGLLLLYLQQNKKSQPPAAPKIVISPFEEAMKQLKKLETDRPEAKQYYSKLTDIFRLYVFRKKGILSLQKTTEDLIRQLRSLNLSKVQLDKLSQSLRLSDIVKFAKYIPANDDDQIIFEEIKDAIIAIENPEANALTLAEM